MIPKNDVQLEVEEHADHSYRSIRQLHELMTGTCLNVYSLMFALIYRSTIVLVEYNMPRHVRETE